MPSRQHHEAGKSWRIAAQLCQIDEVDEQLCAFIKERRIPVDLFAMRLLLREALLNAVTHGAREDATAAIEVVFKISDKRVELSVADPGAGFNWRDAMPYEANLDDRGRGLALMQRYADQTLSTTKATG